MKFVRLDDLLILSKKGTETVEGMELQFVNCDDANYVILYENKETQMTEVRKCELTGSVCSLDELLPDGSYTVRVCTKEENDIEFLSEGRFKLEGGVVCTDSLAYPLEIQKVWRAIIHIAGMLSVDEANIDKLVTGYVTE